MKKYCLTDCAKRKLSIYWEGLFTIVGVIVILFGAVGGFALVSAGIGYVMIEWTGLVKDGTSYIEAGVATIVLSVASGATIYYLSQAAFNLSKKIVISIKDRYEGKRTYCKLFEECEE